MNVLRGTTSFLLRFKILDASRTDGSGLTGLLFSSTGLKCAFTGDGQPATVVSLVDMTVGTWVSGGFKQVDATNLPGYYELGVPNAAMALASRNVQISLFGFAGMVAADREIELVAYDPQDGMRLKLSALPNVAAGANGGLPLGNASGNVTVGAYAANQDPASSVWGALTASFSTANTFGAALGAGAGGLTMDSAYTGHTTAGTMGAFFNHVAPIAIDGSGNVSLSNGTETAIGGAAATAILANPSNKISTNSSGYVTLGAYGTGEDPGTLVWNSLTASFTTSGSFGSAIGGGGSGLTMDSTYTGHATAGTMGALFNHLAPINLDGSGNVGLSAATENAIADAYLDRANGIEAGLTPRQAQRIQTAAVAGVVSGAAGTSISIQAAGNPATLRIAATVDANGNRTAVTLTP